MDLNFPVNSIQELQSLSEEVTWQWFEKLVAFVLSENGFEVKQGVVKSFDRDKRQYDVIAKRFGKTLIVECKKVKRLYPSFLEKEVKKHLERCGRIEGQPLMVTHKGKCGKVNEVPIVPIRNLNAFINSMFI